MFRSLALFLLVALSSCSQSLVQERHQANAPGYDYRDGDKQGVRYKKAISPKTVRWGTVVFAAVVLPILLIPEEENSVKAFVHKHTKN